MAKATSPADITPAQLRWHYERTTLGRFGITFEAAMESATLRRALENAEREHRRIAAKRAARAAIQYQTQEAA